MDLKAQDVGSAISQLLRSFDQAQAEGCSESEKARFKIQEYHVINCFKHAFNQVEYTPNARFVLPRNLTSNNLIEANMNAMRGSYELDKALYKEMIGNLNWKKFSDLMEQELPEVLVEEHTI